MDFMYCSRSSTSFHRADILLRQLFSWLLVAVFAVLSACPCLLFLLVLAVYSGCFERFDCLLISLFGNWNLPLSFFLYWNLFDFLFEK